MGEPRPPAPMHRTLAALIFLWPCQPDFGQNQMPRVAADFVDCSIPYMHDRAEQLNRRIDQE